MDRSPRWVASSDRRWRRDVVLVVAAPAVFVAALVSPLRDGQPVVVGVLGVLALIAWWAALFGLADPNGLRDYTAPTDVPGAPAAAQPGSVQEIARLSTGTALVTRIVLGLAAAVSAAAGIVFSIQASGPPPSDGFDPLGPAITFWVLTVICVAGIIVISKLPRRRIWLDGTVLHLGLVPSRNTDLARVSAAQVVRVPTHWRLGGLLNCVLQLDGDGSLRGLTLTAGQRGVRPAATYRALAGALAANPDRAAVDAAIEELLGYAEISEHVAAAGPRLRRPRNLATLLAALAVAAAVIAAAAVL